MCVCVGDTVQEGRRKGGRGAINSSGPGGDVIIFMTFRFKSNALLNRASLCASSNLQRYFTERPRVCASERARGRVISNNSMTPGLIPMSCPFPTPSLAPCSPRYPESAGSLGAFYQGSMSKIMALRRDAAQCARGIRGAAFDFISRALNWPRFRRSHFTAPVDRATRLVEKREPPGEEKPRKV